MPRNIKEWGMLLVALIGTHLAGVIGSFFTIMSVATWYAFIEKPSFAPPDFIFLPVWLVLYTLMAFAFYLVWRESTWRVDVKWGIRWYVVQLIANIMWPVFFFGFQNTFYGLVDIVFLFIAVSITTFYFSRVSKIAALLMVPYVLWVLYASILNYVIWILN